jgi:hypothetical protein
VQAFIGEVQFVVNYWLTHRGFSVGIGDTVADPETMNKIAQLIQDAKQSVSEIIKQYQGGALEEKPGRCAPRAPCALHDGRCASFAQRHAVPCLVFGSQCCA